MWLINLDIRKRLTLKSPFETRGWPVKDKPTIPGGDALRTRW